MDFDPESKIYSESFEIYKYNNQAQESQLEDQRFNKMRKTNKNPAENNFVLNKSKRNII